MIPAAVGTGVAVLVLKSDSTTKTTIPVNKPRGTVFWGGAGLDGDYLKPLLKAFRDAGIHYIWSGLDNTSTKTSIGSLAGGYIGTLMDAVRTGVMIKNDDGTDNWRVYPPTSTKAAAPAGTLRCSSRKCGPTKSNVSASTAARRSAMPCMGQGSSSVSSRCSCCWWRSCTCRTGL